MQQGKGPRLHVDPAQAVQVGSLTPEAQSVVTDRGRFERPARTSHTVDRWPTAAATSSSVSLSPNRPMQ